MPSPDLSKLSIGGIDILMTDDNAQQRIAALEGKVPAQASDQNPLADKAFVNSSIATATATYRGTFNLVSDLQLTVSATEQQIATALASAISTADNNDYCYVQVPTANDKPTEIARIDRYKNNGTAWALEYTLNNSGYTSAQWAAINSGITGNLVTKLNDLYTKAALDQMFNAKANAANMTAGDYNKVTVNSQGIVTAGSNPTTLSGHGITDAYTKNETGTLIDEKVLVETNRAKDAEAALKSSLSTMNGVFTLEANSNPAFDVSNKIAAEDYIAHMGGYMWYKHDGKWYAAKLNSGTWGKFADGTPVTTAIENACETMIKTPLCNYKGNNKTLIFGGLNPIDGGHAFEAAPWNGAYEASVGADNKLHSRPNTTPAHSRTMSAFWDLAQALDTEAGLSNYQFFCLINALYQAKFGNLNSQTVIGPGGQTSAWDKWRDVAMGQTKSLGDGCGKVLYNDANVGDQYSVKLFGFENLWGKLWEFRPGVRYYMDDGVRHAVVYDGNRVSNVADGRDISGILQSAGGQYATKMLLGEYWDMICQEVGGGDSTYYCDGYWAATSGELLIVGGSSYYFALCGVSYSASDRGFGDSYAAVGARLAFYAEPTIVSGAELAAMVGS